MSSSTWSSPSGSPSSPLGNRVFTASVVDESGLQKNVAVLSQQMQWRGRWGSGASFRHRRF